jgi:hypothetical protein
MLSDPFIYLPIKELSLFVKKTVVSDSGIVLMNDDAGFTVLTWVVNGAILTRSKPEEVAFQKFPKRSSIVPNRRP